MKKEHQEKQLVVKENRLMEARYKLSACEQKLILYAISKIKPTDSGSTRYTFQIQEFEQLLGVGDKSIYRTVRNLTKNILRKPISLFPDPNTKEELQMNWFAIIKYLPNTGTVKFGFVDEIIPFLFNLKERFNLDCKGNATGYQLQNIMHLRSSYSIRIYELLKQYQTIGAREILLNDLRKMVGVEDGTFKMYHDFKRKVLDIAKDELLANSDIKFEYEEIKQSRAVHAINFLIKANIRPEQQKESSGDDNEDLATLVALVPVEYRHQKTIHAMITARLKKESFQYVRRNILYANEHSNQPGKYRAYLGKALKEGFASAPGEEEKKPTPILIHPGQQIRDTTTGKVFEIEEGNYIRHPSGTEPEGFILQKLRQGEYVFCLP